MRNKKKGGNKNNNLPIYIFKELTVGTCWVFFYTLWQLIDMRLSDFSVYMVLLYSLGRDEDVLRWLHHSDQGPCAGWSGNLWWRCGHTELPDWVWPQLCHYSYPWAKGHQGRGRWGMGVQLTHMLCLCLHVFYVLHLTLYWSSNGSNKERRFSAMFWLFLFPLSCFDPFLYKKSAIQ